MKAFRATLDWMCREPKPLVISVAVLCFLAGASFHSSGSFLSAACLAVKNPNVDCSWGDWLYRWQSLVGAGIALFAAMIAVQPVFRQLAETQRQAAASGILTIRDVAREIEAELGRLDELSPTIAGITHLLRHSVGQIDLATLEQARRALHELANSIVPHFRHHPVLPTDEPTELRIVRRTVLTMARAFEVQLEKLGDAQVLMQKRLPDVSAGFRLIRSQSTQWAEEWDAQVKAYRDGLELTARRYWIRASELERTAIGDN